MDFHKLVFLLWAPAEPSPDALRHTLLETCAPRLLEAGAVQLAMNLADAESRMRSPSPALTLDPPICAEVSAWVEDLAHRRGLEAPLNAAGFRVAAYRVRETVYTDYGDNRHARPRDWPDGQRSPGVVQVNLLERPRRLDHAEWMRRWHGRMSPVSEAIQPRTRYVRNEVLEALTPDAPRFAAIVEEAYPSKRHIANPFLYFGAARWWQLPGNLLRILGAVTSFLTLGRIRARVMGGYLVRTDPRVPQVRRSEYDVGGALSSAASAP
jgi:hypothetical protein